MANTRPSTDSVTVLAPLDVHDSSIIVGALQDTGDEGAAWKPLMRTLDVVPPAVVAGVGAVVVVAVRRGAVVEVVARGAVVGAFVEVVELGLRDVDIVVVVDEEEP